MLQVQSNAARTVYAMPEVWDFRLTDADAWRPVAVPASYNDQSADPRFRSFVGVAHYKTHFTVPAAAAGRRVVLRFGAVTHDAHVRLNGKPLCSHRGGFLPFEADITHLAAPGETALLEVDADNRIGHDTLPVGNEGGVAFFGSDNPGIPSVEAGKRMQGRTNQPNFDFFNYAGITRPVILYTTPREYVQDIAVVTEIDGTDGIVDVCAAGHGKIAIEILDASGARVAAGEGAHLRAVIPDVKLWQPRPGTPYLYTARVRCGEDVYDQTFGVRTVEVDGARVLINGKPFYFKGPNRHEDAPFIGRGHSACVTVRDLDLLCWLGANTVRTSHYPDSELLYDLCDRLGIVVIDETPAVGIGAGASCNPYRAFPLADYHAQVLADMIARDKNHPCVVLWSLGNEPDTEHFPDDALAYWSALYRRAHDLDPQNRPVTMVCCQNDYTKDITTRTMDVVCINRYYGWYNLSNDLETAKRAFDIELDFWEKIGKPLILSEYGADTLPGHHAAAPEMFTEEFQAAFYEAINSCLDARDFVVGELPWCFADFDAQPGPMRPGGNRKGLFTRDRRPKLAAHTLRRRWTFNMR